MANEASPFLVKAIYAFKGTNNDELNFQKGDIITVTQSLDGGWWEGTLNDTTGWFPSNYVKEYKQADPNTRKKIVSASFPDFMNNRQESMWINRNVVIKDMIESEKAHVNDLQSLIKSYLHPLQNSDILAVADYNSLVSNLEEVVDHHKKLVNLLEECTELPAKQQRIGGIFMQLATQLKTLHLTYCSNHPRAVTILEKYRDDLTAFMESHGAPTPGIMIITTGLSKPFRRLEKYPGLLQELERHMEESHADRGDTQRAIHVYRDIAASCLAIRRQREMELEVVTGIIHGWEGEEINTLGEIISMCPVITYTEARERKDRYLVLFNQVLILLSVSPRMSAFLYEGRLPLSGIHVNKLEDTENCQNSFEITGQLIEKIVIACTSKEEQEKWIDLLHHYVQLSRSSSQTKTHSHVSNTPAPSSSDGKHQNSPLKEQGVSHNCVWTMSCLRPAPPLRPCLALGLKDDIVQRRHSSRPQRKKEDRTYDDDAQILRVIEAYCTSAKTRYTVNSVLLDSPQILIAEEEKIIVEETTGVEEKSLVDTVYALKDSVKELKQKITLLSKNLDDERSARKHLEEIIKKHVLAGRHDINWEE